jgi:hypothetical protein
MKSTYCEYISEKILSTFEEGPILALIAPSPLLKTYKRAFCSNTLKKTTRWRGTHTSHILDLIITNSLKIDKSPGPDELHPRLLKELAKSLTKPLCIIFDQSLRLKMIPMEWKKATISAIFKKGNRLMAGNYRPVSITSVICKLLEKIIREHIIKHMKVNKLFSNKQFGFISGRSTSLQLLEVLDKWTEAIDKGTDVDVIYMDFQKAFDKVPHKRLIGKAKNYVKDNPLLEWIEDFLTGRTQRVLMDQHLTGKK